MGPGEKRPLGGAFHTSVRQVGTVAQTMETKMSAGLNSSFGLQRATRC